MLIKANTNWINGEPKNVPNKDLESNKYLAAVLAL